MKHGWVWIDGMQRPISAAREIKKGKRKGSFMVKVGKSKRERAVYRESIRVFPGGDNV